MAESKLDRLRRELQQAEQRVAHDQRLVREYQHGLDLSRQIRDTALAALQAALREEGVERG